MKTDRRNFLLTSGLALGTLALPRAASTAPKPEPGIGAIGVQLYSVRKAMQADFGGTLKKVAGIGYKQVEFAGLFGHSAAQVRSTLDGLGLTAPSMHVPFETLEQGWDAVLSDAHQLGCRYVVVPSIPGALRSSLDDYRRVAERFTRGAEAAAKAGIGFAYHNHDIDFAPLDHRLPFDVLLEASDPSLVKFELDLYWIVRAGQDPLRYFNRWPGRGRLVHVKDTMGAPDHRMTEVGSGIIDWPHLLASAKGAGVEHFIVEHDEAADPLASISKSFSYLRDLRLLPTAAAHHGRLKQSIARWTLKDIALPEACRRAKAIGFDAIDLLYPDEWQVARDAGMTCSMGYASRRDGFIQNGFNDPANHAVLLAELEASIPLAARAGVPNLIAMFGNRHGVGPDEVASCAAGLSKIAPLAEKHGVTICVELLNSRIDHTGYQGDHTAFGVEVVQAVHSLRVKLLYDIYHMQIMEGDVIRTIRNNIPWIAHFHTGGVPGRHEIDETQELNYRAVAKAIADTGFPGYVAHEFLPVGDPFKAFAEAYRIFDV